MRFVQGSFHPRCHSNSPLRKLINIHGWNHGWIRENSPQTTYFQQISAAVIRNLFCLSAGRAESFLHSSLNRSPEILRFSLFQLRAWGGGEANLKLLNYPPFNSFANYFVTLDFRKLVTLFLCWRPGRDTEEILNCTNHNENEFHFTLACIAMINEWTTTTSEKKEESLRLRGNVNWMKIGNFMHKIGIATCRV